MEETRAYAISQDQADELSGFRSEFHFPNAVAGATTGSDAIPAGADTVAAPPAGAYFCGNSLGLQPKGAAAKVEEVLQNWREYAVDGYGRGSAPWMTYADRFKTGLSTIVGCLPAEVSVMNTLTVNLHLLLCSFYNPSKTRYKIIIEAGAFPSDQYAAQTQIRFHGLRPEDVLVEVTPRPGEKLIREEDLLALIKENDATLSLVLLGGVSYYTGQFFDLARITAAAHAVGALAGFDLAHAVGNVPLKLHDWDVDFAVWCSYKYLNGGPGASGAIYIHERWSMNPAVTRLGGWGGSEAKTRFLMPREFVPEPGADGWNLSVGQALVLASLEASLELFERAGMDRIRAKSLRLTGYLEYLLSRIPGKKFELITPADPGARGAQLSLFFPTGGAALQAALSAKGILVDYREPGVVRVSPAPLYNSFADVFLFYETIIKNLPE